MLICFIYSQNDILPYNSLGQSDNFQYGNRGEEHKRLSKEGDFTRISHSVLEHLEDELSEDNEESTTKHHPDQRLYYEPKDSRRVNKPWFKEKEANNQTFNMRIRSDDESERINASEGSMKFRDTGYPEEAKKPKVASRKEKKHQKNNKFLSPNTFVEKQQNSMIDESMSSNHSSLNKSLKMQQRRQKKQSRNVPNPAAAKPRTYAELQQMRNLNS